MLRGFIHATPLYPAGPQRKALEAAGCRVVYQAGKNESLKDFLKSLRVGDVVVVAGLGRLAPTRSEFHLAIEAIEKRGAKVKDARTGQVVDSLCVALVADAFREIAGEARIKTPEIAKLRGEQGGRPKIRLKRDMREIWFDKSIPSNAAAAEIITAAGFPISAQTLRRRYGPSGRPAGWPERLTKGRKAKPSN